MVRSIVSSSICCWRPAARSAPSTGINLVLACPASGALAMMPTTRRGRTKPTPRSRPRLPDDQARFRLTNAHGAGNAGGNSSAERLQVWALHERDEIKTTRHGVDLRDHGVSQLHPAQFPDELLDAAGLGRDEHVRGDHSGHPPHSALPCDSSRESVAQPHLNSSSGTLPVRAMSSSWCWMRATAGASGNIVLLTCMSASVDSGCQNTPSRFTVTSGTRFAMLNTSPSRE